jgi:hypothetical protein
VNSDKISPRASVVYYGSVSAPVERNGRELTMQLVEARFTSLVRARRGLDAYAAPEGATRQVTVWRERTNQRDALARRRPGTPWEYLDRLLGEWVALGDQA